MQIIDGKKLASAIRQNIKEEISKLPFKPVFCDVLVGDDPASAQYVQMKARTAEVVGFQFHKATFPASISTEDLIKEIEVLNKIENMCGIIVQLPLPKSIDKRGNLSMGFKEHISFPEIFTEKEKTIFGLEITVVTNAKSKEEGLELYQLLGFPMKETK